MVLALVACAPDPAAENPAAAPTKVVNPAGPPAAPTKALDPAPLPAPTTVTSRVPCDLEIAIDCPDGYEDGCAGNRTTSMACVKKSAKAVIPCDREIVFRCGPGEISSCYADPPYGTLHICVKS